MPITKYDPFAELEFPTGARLFQDAVNRLFSEPATRPWAPAPTMNPKAPCRTVAVAAP